ncbi:MAG: hypothetical protein ACAI35_19135 [Candidatus Methylacidiphilales bacterium]|nr:hypothetical protein [Candidatus Methylacidiphilales bacterium]
MRLSRTNTSSRTATSLCALLLAAGMGVAGLLAPGILGTPGYAQAPATATTSASTNLTLPVSPPDSTNQDLVLKHNLTLTPADPSRSTNLYPSKSPGGNSSPGSSASFAVPTNYMPKLSSLAVAPDWSRLEPYQYTMTRHEFARWVDEVYAPNGAFWRYAHIDDEKLVLYGEADAAPPPLPPVSSSTATNSVPLAPAPPLPHQPSLAFATNMPPPPAHGLPKVELPRTKIFTLYFAKDSASAKPKPVHFKPEQGAPWSLPPQDPARPLLGVRILLDPGHIGGDYATMEERFFQLGVGKPAVVEGDLTYQTCKHIKKELEALGAEIAWTKAEGEPATTLRAKDLRDAAIKLIADGGGAYPNPPTAQELLRRLNREANSLFYRTAEIRARANIVPQFKPDLIICVHYNASPWGYERKAMLNDVDRLVVFINGMYSLGELANDDQKFSVVHRVLARITPLELNISDRVSAEMAASLGLPPETYRGSPTMRQMGSNPYVFARNLLANRIFDAPVVYVEGPYMNSKTSYPRFVAGDYEGERKINDKMHPSIVREMSHCITRGVLAYFTQPPRNAEGRSPLAGPAEWPWTPLTSDLNPAPLPPFPPPPPPKPVATNAPVQAPGTGASALHASTNAAPALPPPAAATNASPSVPPEPLLNYGDWHNWSPTSTNFSVPALKP